MVMTPIQFSQYRTFDHTILFKAKEDESLVLKVYNLAQQLVFTKTFSSKEMSIVNLGHVFTKEDPHTLVEKLLQKELLSEDKLPDLKLSQISLKECLEGIEKQIHQMKPKLVLESSEIEKFSCPISLEVFREPMMDNHGHTFEKEEIERHLKTSKSCPVSREPIEFLTPNLLIKQTIEEAQSKGPIPTFAGFKKDNAKLAGNNLKMAKAYEQEGEFEEALKMYSSAFQYTKNPQAYVSLPLLFQKMKEPEKATLAFLYLAQYQLEEKQVCEAIQTLENAQQVNPEAPLITLLLIYLYRSTEQTEKALHLAKEKGEFFSEKHPQEAISLYKQAVIIDPDDSSIYFALSSLLKDTQERAHLLLMGACHALQRKSYLYVSNLCRQAEEIQSDSFIDQLVQLELLKQQNKAQPLIERLLDLAKTYQKKQLLPQKLKAYKMLIYLEQKPSYYEEIINTYEQLQKPQQVLQWRQKFLTFLIHNKKWQVAETLAQEILKSTSEPIFAYGALETIYTDWQSHKLCNLYTQLGKEQMKSNQVALAEKTYQKAFNTFQTIEHALALAEALNKQHKHSESIKAYYEAATIALVDDSPNVVTECVRMIKQIDPKMQYLDSTQKIHILLCDKIFQLQKELQEKGAELSNLKEKLTPSLKPTTPLFLVETKEPAVLFQAFGKERWNAYFGDVGVEPPLPPNITEILTSPCPFWESKKVYETHMLTLIPSTVNGKPLTLNTLGKLIQSSKRGNATKYELYWDAIQEKYGDDTVKSSYWLLMTKDVIEGSRSKRYRDQTDLLRSLSKKYAPPQALETAVSILMFHVRTGERLFGVNPFTYTRCCEDIKGNQVVIGGFAPEGAAAGLSLGNGTYNRSDFGLAARRKF